MKQYEKKFDAQGRAYLETSLPGLMLTRLPLLNKGTNFTREEREEFGLLGLLPPRISSMEEQLERHYSNFRKLTDDLERHVFLRAMQDRSEVLFYALLERHLEEMMPLIYTPVVAQAVQQFSRIYRYPRGLVVSPENIDHLDDLLENIAFPDVRAGGRDRQRGHPRDRRPGRRRPGDLHRQALALHRSRRGSIPR